MSIICECFSSPAPLQLEALVAVARKESFVISNNLNLITLSVRAYFQFPVGCVRCYINDYDKASYVLHCFKKNAVDNKVMPCVFSAFKAHCLRFSSISILKYSFFMSSTISHLSGTSCGNHHGENMFILLRSTW